MQILIIHPFSFDSLKKIINFEPDNEATSNGLRSYKTTSNKLRVTINDNSKLRLIYGRF